MESKFFMRQTTSTYDYGQRTTRNINTTVRLRVLYCRKLPTDNAKGTKEFQTKTKTKPRDRAKPPALV